MHLRCLLRCSVLWILLTSAGIQCGAVTVSNDEIARAIGQLGATEYKSREEASKFLWSAGRAALPALQEAAKSPDPEISLRAQQILQNLRDGVLPDTPDAMKRLAKRYREANSDAKQAVIDEMLATGTAAYPTVLALIDSETDSLQRQNIARHFSEKVGTVVPKLLADGQFDSAESSLALAASSGEDAALRNYAAFLLLRGKLDDKIREYRAKLDGPAGAAAAKMLAVFYRASGDLAQAKSAAQKSKDPELLKGVLAELDDWKGVAATQVATGENADPRQELERVQFLVNYTRLAGDTQTFEEAIKRMIALEDAQPNIGCPGCTTLLVNDRRQMEHERVLGFTWAWAVYYDYCVEKRFHEALEVAQKTIATGSEDAYKAQWESARLLYRLGERDRCLETLRTLAGESKGAADANKLTELIEAINSIGQVSWANEVAAPLLEKLTDEQRQRVFRVVFPERQNLAAVLWNSLRLMSTNDPPAVALQGVRDVLDGKTRDDALVPIAVNAIQQSAALPAEQRDVALCDLGRLCEAASRDDVAMRCYESAVENSARSEPLVAAGQLCLKQKRWKEAADCCARAAQKDPHEAAAYFLRGWALQQTGDNEESGKLMNLAELIPLADAEARLRLAEVAGGLGLSNVVQRQSQLIARTGEFFYDCDSKVPVALADAAVATNDFFTAAGLRQRALLSVNHSGTVNTPATNTWFYWQDNILDPYRIHLLRARGFLARKDVKSTMQEARLCLDLVPGEVSLPLVLVPELERQGHKKEADELLDAVSAHLDKLCAEFPHYAEGREDLARLAKLRSLGQPPKHD